jgi:hypothetical protein
VWRRASSFGRRIQVLLRERDAYGSTSDRCGCSYDLAEHVRFVGVLSPRNTRNLLIGQTIGRRVNWKINCVGSVDGYSSLGIRFYTKSILITRFPKDAGQIL